MRAMHDAVLTGIGTVLADDPLLTCRLPRTHSPVRVVLDSTLRLPLSCRLVASATQVPLWVIAGETAASEREQALTAKGVEVLRVRDADGTPDLAATLRLLGERGITRLIVEAGPILSTALLRADLIDEAAIFRAPATIGTEGLGALDGVALSALTQSPRLARIASEEVGHDRLDLFERP
jgi:diaminohydroxyphosphoribosylaminopyrimidine deaminase/5-amino-6-(5-phosphoribosylamino)uracil reductase